MDLLGVNPKRKKKEICSPANLDFKAWLTIKVGKNDKVSHFI